MRTNIVHLASIEWALVVTLSLPPEVSMLVLVIDMVIIVMAMIALIFTFMILMLIKVALIIIYVLIILLILVFVMVFVVMVIVTLVITVVIILITKALLKSEAGWSALPPSSGASHFNMHTFHLTMPTLGLPPHTQLCLGHRIS